MKVEDLLRDSLHDLADKGAAPRPGFADRVLAARRRRRTRRHATVIAAVAAVVAVAVTGPLLGRGDGPEPADKDKKAVDVIARTDQSPPRELIAAADVAVSAYTVPRTVMLKNKDKLRTRVWYLYDPRTGRYQKTGWGWVAVAPGMRRAAVLEGELPAGRIGLLDLATGKVDRWIRMARPVGGLAFSPDGTRLVATSYSCDPDLLRLHEDFYHGYGDDPDQDAWLPQRCRTGFTVLDARSGQGEFAAVPESDRDGDPEAGGRNDFAFSADGRLLSEHLPTAKPYRRYYDAQGTAQPVPDTARHLDVLTAGVSPDGRRIAQAKEVLDARTGRKLHGFRQPVLEFLAWADDDHLIAWGCEPDHCGGKGEFTSRLVLVSPDDDEIVPLSGYRGETREDGDAWTPVFTRRR
ncbi:hypothetical protein AB0M28_22445 [Streptomyces sp. NPDC051940]|uniref:hypothetical protein n=1 Tax=Streptomyces sp. NPDC051940 TaxID=3155675 RepID=UPI0034344465